MFPMIVSFKILRSNSRGFHILHENSPEVLCFSKVSTAGDIFVVDCVKTHNCCF